MGNLIGSLVMMVSLRNPHWALELDLHIWLIIVNPGLRLGYHFTSSVLLSHFHSPAFWKGWSWASPDIVLEPQMYGTTFFEAFEVFERTAISKRSIKGLFVFVTIVVFFSIGIVGRYKENDVESERMSEELGRGGPEENSTNDSSNLNLTITGILEARRSLLLGHCTLG